MKRFVTLSLAFVFALCACVCAHAQGKDATQKDWAKFYRYEKANAEVEKLNSTPNMSYQLYEEENAKINLIFAEAIPWLEKAYAINPTDGATLEYLNMLCFRLRDLDGMMDKYNKYHELYMNR